MKKGALIFLLTIYTLSACGLSINRFYCCGALQSTSISAAIYNEAAKNDGCCRHTQTILKVSDSHENIQPVHVDAPFAGYAVAAHIIPAQASFLSYHTIAANHINGPPGATPPVPLYIHNCVYRI